MAGETGDQRSGFQSLPLDLSYRTGSHDLLSEFYVPCLKRSTTYDRAAGYFDSKSLVLAAEGIAHLIVAGGKMRLIASPRLSESDIEAIKSGISPEKVVKESLMTGLSEEQFSDYLKRDRFRCLAWMLKEERLEIKIGYMNNRAELNPFSHYHEKMGIFVDSYGNRVAFSGSLNETELGWTDNYESFDVFCSWRQGESRRVDDKEDNFEQLWNNEDPKITTKSLPDAVKEGLEKHSPETKDGLPDIESVQELAAEFERESNRDLWDHQADAIDWWINNDYQGIFAMATGTGKTYTALRAARLQADGRLTLIVVPQSSLLGQWEDEVYTVFGETAEVLRCEGGTNWRSEITRFVDPYRLDDDELIFDSPRQVILTTIQTASGDSFQRYMEYIVPDRIQIIADEVHNYGAPTFQRLFNVDASRRVGLSATPERQWDEEGTEVIMDYFGQNVFEFGTQDAIDNGYLTQYEYHPIICELIAEEYENYRDYTQKIGQISSRIENAGKKDNTFELRNKRERLLRDRAKIKKKASKKPAAFVEFLESNHPTPAIIFCEDNDQIKSIESALNERDVNYERYVSRMSEQERDEVMYKFENGVLDYLLAINCLDEGVDVPDCSTAVLIASSTSERQFIQRRGRVLRKSDNKDIAVIFDIITLPGFEAGAGDEIARSLIEQELRRAGVLVSCAENKFEIEDQLYDELDSYGFGHLAYIND